jgi:peptide/nickel transport system permease protein
MSAAYFGRRLLQSLLSLVALMVVVFFLTRLTGSPVDLYLPLDATQTMRDELTARLGLDKSIVLQFLDWLASMARLDMGMSLWQSRPALTLVLEALPQTLILGALVIALALLLAMIVGALAAFRPHGIFDRIASSLTLAGSSVPDFWLALMGILLFATMLRLLPTSGFGGPIYWVLPVATLVLRPFGVLVQIVRGAMISALNSSYARTARAKGAQEARVIFIHAMRNALLPVVTVAGDLAAQFAGGVTVVEVIFNWPGIGKLIIDAIFNRDFAVIQAGVLAVATVVALINLSIDLAYGAIDPRVRLER